MSNFIHLLRCMFDNAGRYVLEPVTRKKIEYDMLEASGSTLAYFSKAGLLAQTKVYMQDEEFRPRMHAMGHREALPDLVEYIEEMSEGWEWSPLQGGTKSFGYYSDTEVWILPHHKVPTLFYRYGQSETQERVLDWLQGYLDKPPVPYPVSSEETLTLIVPETHLSRFAGRGVLQNGNQKSY